MEWAQSSKETALLEQHATQNAKPNVAEARGGLSDSEGEEVPPLGVVASMRQVFERSS